MKNVRLALLALLLIVPFAATAHSQVYVGVGVGPAVVAAPVAYGPPVCEWGYYQYYPYDCAPYGYYGPDWFVSGLFIGAGPWYHWGWGRGWGHYGYGYRAGWGGYRGGYGGHGGYGYRGGYGGVRPGWGGNRGYGGGHAFGPGGGQPGGGWGGRGGGGGGHQGGGGGGFHGGGGGGGGHGGGGHR